MRSGTEYQRKTKSTLLIVLTVFFKLGRHVEDVHVAF